MVGNINVSLVPCTTCVKTTGLQTAVFFILMLSKWAVPSNLLIYHNFETYKNVNKYKTYKYIKNGFGLGL